MREKKSCWVRLGKSSIMKNWFLLQIRTHRVATLCTIKLPQWTWYASDGAVWPAEPPTGPRQHRHPALWPTHMCAAHAHAPLWTRSTSAQRNSFSNFPWLRKQYTCLNNVDISNALKHSSNGALIGCKWIQDGKHSVGDPALYHGLLDL